MWIEVACMAQKVESSRKVAHFLLSYRLKEEVVITLKAILSVSMYRQRATQQSKSKEGATHLCDFQYNVIEHLSFLSLSLLHARMAISAFTTFGLIEFFYLNELCLFVTCNDHLRNAFTIIDGKRFI